MNKTVLSSFTVLCLLSTVFLIRSKSDIQTVKAVSRIWTVDDDGPADFTTLQEHEVIESQENWSIKTPMPTPRHSFAIAEVDGKIYCVGGSNRSEIFDLNEVYDPRTDSWTSKEPMPYGCFASAAGVVDGRIYVLGGRSSGYPLSAGYEQMSIVQEYDPVTDTWTIRASMPTPRYDFAIGVVSNKIYAIGGYFIYVLKRWAWSVGIVEEYDPSTNSWVKKTSMPTARHGHAIGVFDNKIYAIGGRFRRIDGQGSRANNVGDVNEVYDPSTDSWRSRAPLPTPRYGLAVSVANQRIYALGGHGGESVNEEYEPLSDTWTTRVPMLTGREWLGAITVGQKIYAIGGCVEGSGQGCTDEYTPPSHVHNSDTRLNYSTIQSVIYKLRLLAPWIGLASLLTAVATVSVVYVKHRKKQQT